MSAIQLLERLHELDVTLSFDGERLRLNAPAGVVTPELREQIALHKGELRALVTSAREEATSIPRIERSGELPLSATQRRMWVLHRLDPASATYHIVHADRLRGRFNRAALEDAWLALGMRQESLRTRIVESAGAPYVAIDQAPAPLRFEDLSELPGEKRERAWRALADAEAHRPFDLASGPLAELIAIRLWAEEHVVVVRLHHIIADQWSLGILRRELATLYAQAQDVTAQALGPLPIQYVDYAAWSEAQANDETRDPHLAYWRSRLRGLEPLELPSLEARNPLAETVGDRWTATLPAGLLDRLSHMANRAGATLFMGLLAAYATVLSRYSGRTDFAIGTPVAGRGRVELEGIIGAFINTLVLRVSLDPQRRFLDLLASVKQITLDAYAHQDIPFEQLVAELETTRRAGHSPLVQVMFNFLNVSAGTLELPGALVESVTVDRRAAAFDLSLIVDASERTVTAEFRPDVIPVGGIRLLVAHYIRALEAVADDPELPVGLLPMLGGEERAAIAELNDTSTALDRGRDVEQLIAAQARLTPSGIAVRSGEANVTYRELDERSSILANRLRARGVGQDVLVGICLERSEQLPIALLAVMKAGGAYLPLDPDLPAARLAWMLSDSGTALVLGDEGGAAALQAFDVDVMRLDGEETLQSPRLVAAPTQADGEDLAYVLYTSGSTGQPKGVQIPRRALANFVEAMRERPGISSSDVLVAVTTLSFDIAALEIWLPLTVGATVVIASRADTVDGHRLLALARQTGASMMQATPTTWRLMIEAGWDGSPALRVLVGGEALPPDLATALTTRASEVWNLYGPTETTIWSTAERITPDSRIIGIGAPIANTEVYVLDRSMQLLPIGVPGELYIGGDGVAIGYLGRPDLTASRFVPDLFSGRPGARLYRTGDRVRLRPEGRLEYLGRFDTQVKLRGFRIELGEIEATLLEHPSVRSAAVAIHGDGDTATLVAYVTRTPTTTHDESALRALLRSRLPAYMVPSAFVELDALPLTPNGKIDRKALPAPAPTVEAAPRVADPRVCKTEQVLAHIWCKLLKLPQVNVGDDFFQLGGHSLQAMRLVAQIYDAFGVSLPPAVLFTHSTLEALAGQIEAARLAGPLDPSLGSILVPLARGGSGTPFFWAHGVGGEVFSYMRLSELIGRARPVFGFSADWTQFADNKQPTLEHMAERYITKLRVVHPNGPYLLGGYCSAALLAFEMARQLDALGAEVGLVIAVDYHAAPPRPTSRLQRLRAFVRNVPLWWEQDAMSTGAHDFVGRLQSALRRGLGRVTRTHAIDVRDELGLWKFPEHQVPMLRALQQALGNYQLRPAPARVAVFLSQASPVFGPFVEHFDNGWHRVAQGGVEEHVVRGSHGTLMKDPFVVELADRLEQSLLRAEEELRTRHVPARSA